MTRATGPFRRVLRKVDGRYRSVLESRAVKSTAKRALEFARADIGYTEEPERDRNDNRYGRHWQENFVPWCGLAVAYWWRKAGFRVDRELALLIDYVPELVSLAQRRLHGLFVVGKNRVRLGDAVALDFPGGERADHVELFDRWVDKRRGVFATIGGNTSRASSQSNGGAVCPQVRRMEQVVAFVRMGRVIL